MCLCEGVLCLAPGSHALFEHLNIQYFVNQRAVGLTMCSFFPTIYVHVQVIGKCYFYKMRKLKMKLIVVRKVNNSDPESSES